MLRHVLPIFLVLGSAAAQHPDPRQIHWQRSLEDALAVAARVRLFTRATSLGSVESLIEHRASMEGPGTSTPASLLRLSIGLEHPDDLIEDLTRALG